MSDSGSFTSLMAMVESHLSKTSISTTPTNQQQAGPSFSLPNICSVRNINSDTVLHPPTKVMQLPRFEVKDSDITDILAKQVKTLKNTQENTMDEENEILTLTNGVITTELKDKKDDYMIDLSTSIIRPNHLEWEPISIAKSLSTASNISSMESLFSEKDIEISKNILMSQEQLPICDDISYILYQNVRRGKCSSFGKVLTSKLRPVAAPYLHTNISYHNIVPFDFLSLSPCDTNKERRLHPLQDPYTNMNMVDRFMAKNRDEAP